MAEGKCVFCSIAAGQIPSKVVYQDDAVTSVLDINPASKGHTHLVQDRLQTDMSRGVLMTLSFIAVNKKMKQAELVKRRGTIVYQHLKELKSRGFVTIGEEDGHRIVRISPSFYDYFDVDAKELKELTNSIKEEMAKEPTEQNVTYTGN